MLQRIVLFVIIVLSISGQAQAETDSSDDTRNCWVQAGNRYDVNPWLLYAIAIKESSLDPQAINQNPPKGSRPGSRDVGLMQINSFWFSSLSEMGISEEDLYDPCTNINVGAWVLSQKIRIFGNTWTAVGAYNAGTAKTPGAESRRQKYADSVRRILERHTHSM